MRTRSSSRRPGRLRALAVGGVVLGGLAAGGSALSATAADAATLAPNTTSCGNSAYYIPQGDVVTLTAPSDGLRYIVAAGVVDLGSGPVGSVVSSYQFPGQSWQSSVQAQLSTSSQVAISDFGVTMGFDSQAGQYLPIIVFSTCTWTAQFNSVPADTGSYSASSGTSSGTDMAGYYAGMAQYQGIMNSVGDDEGAGISADPGGDAAAGDGD